MKYQPQARIQVNPTQAMRQALHKTSYLLLVEGDEIQYYNHSGCLSEPFKIVTTTLIEDLNLLLHLKNELFWEHLLVQGEKQVEQVEGNQNLLEWKSLRACLESCLQIFARKAYMNYEISVEAQYLKELSYLPKENLQLWSQLKKIVLLIFHRIASAKSQKQRYIMFDFWYIDNIKLLNLCLIYGQLNPEIISKIVEKTHLCNPHQYFDDFKKTIDRFEWRLYNLCEATTNVKIDMKKSLTINKQQMNFQNVYETIYDVIFSLMFGMADLLFNLENALKFFPKHCKLYVVGTTILFKRLITAYCKSREGIDNRDKTDQLANKLHGYVQLIRYKIASFFVDSLKFIKEQVGEQINPNSEIFFKMKMTFINIGYYTLSDPHLMQYDQHNKELKIEYLRYCEELLLWIMSQSRTERVFAVKSIVNLFDKNHPNFIHIKKMIAFEKKFCNELWPQLQILKQMENWKLKNFQQFINEERIIEIQEKARKQSQMKIIEKMKEYNDQPEFSQDEECEIVTQKEVESDQQASICSPLEEVYMKISQKRLEKKIEAIPKKQEFFLSYEDPNLFLSQESNSGMTLTEYSKSEEYFSMYTE